MSIYDPNAIRAQIKSILNGVTSLAFVYDYNNPNIEGYPAVIFDISQADGQMLDEANNLRVITFTIYITQEVKTSGMQTAKTILDNTTKDVINALEKVSNASLNNTVDWTMPVIGKRTTAESPEGAIFYQEINLKCNLLSSIL